MVQSDLTSIAPLTTATMESKPLVKKASKPAVNGKTNKVAKGAAKEVDKEARIDSNETFKHFRLEQAQNRRWLDVQRADLDLGGDLTEDMHLELLDYFSYSTAEQRERSGELSAECKEIVARLEGERARSLAIQGGVRRPRDWFLSKDEEKDLVSQLDQATIHGTPEERAYRVHKNNKNKRRKVQRRLNKALNKIDQLNLTEDRQKPLARKKSKPRFGKKPNRKGKRILAFLEKKKGEGGAAEAAAAGDGSSQAMGYQGGEGMNVDEEAEEALL